MPTDWFRRPQLPEGGGGERTARLQFPLSAIATLRHGVKLASSVGAFRWIDLMAIFFRFAGAFVLFAPVAWIVLPVAVDAAALTRHIEGCACHCCEDVGPCCDE
jgi:hypothetical protein